MRLPSTADTGSTQERVGWPSTWTVHAPHIAIPQPYLVPVSPSSSRNTQSRGISGSTSTLTAFPFTLSFAIDGLPDEATRAHYSRPRFCWSSGKVLTCCALVGSCIHARVAFAPPILRRYQSACLQKCNELEKGTRQPQFERCARNQAKYGKAKERTRSQPAACAGRRTQRRKLQAGARTYAFAGKSAQRRFPADVNQIAASVFRVGLLVVGGRLGFLRAEAHRFDLAGRHTHQHQRTLDRISAALAEREVVFAAAALVAVALYTQLHILVRQEKLAVRLHDGQILLFHAVGVVVVVDGARGERLNRVHRRDGRLRLFDRLLFDVGPLDRSHHRCFGLGSFLPGLV